MKEIKYRPTSVKEVLIEMKDVSELMVDLAYSSVLFEDKDIAEEVLRLEEKMNTLMYQLTIAAMLSARTVEDAEGLTGLIQIAYSAEWIANAAKDLAKVTLLKQSIPKALFHKLIQAEEAVIRLKVEKDSVLDNQTLGSLKLQTETGMTVIAVRRDFNWNFDPEKDTLLKRDDIIFAKGPDEGVPLIYKFATSREFKRAQIEWSELPPELERAFDILIDLKNLSELAVGLAYSSVMYYYDELANEVQILESEIDTKMSELEDTIFETVRWMKNTDQIKGLLQMGLSSEKISDAAFGIAEVVLRDIEPHPVINMAIKESDEIITKVVVEKVSTAVGKSLKELQLETETGMSVIAIKRGSKWIYAPKARTELKEGDILITKGPMEGEALMKDVCGAGYAGSN